MSFVAFALYLAGFVVEHARKPVYRLVPTPVAILWIVVLCLGAIASGDELWKKIDLPARPLSITASGHNLWTCGTKEMIAESQDGGATWKVKHLNSGGEVLLSIGSANDNLAYAAGLGGTVLLTVDDGATWKKINAGSDAIFQAAFSDPLHGLIQTNSGVMFTADGGAGWSQVSVIGTDDGLRDFQFVRNVAALNSDRMAVLLKNGADEHYDQRLVVTQDAGKTWRIVNIPNVGITTLLTHDGQYWTMGHEVIDKDKPGGGYGVALIMHSADGVEWQHFSRPPLELASCSTGGCLFGDGAGLDPFGESPLYWTYAPIQTPTAKWAKAAEGICFVATALECASVREAESTPKLGTLAPIPSWQMPPRLGSPRPAGLACIFCSYERFIVNDEKSGASEIDLEITVGVDGTVTDVRVTGAPSPEIGSRIASEVRDWILEPLTQNGVRVQARAPLRLQVQLIKS